MSAALEKDGTLLEDALASNVILATPNSLIALLWAIAAGWRQDKLTSNVEMLQTVGIDIHNKSVTLVERLSKLGRSLSSCVENYNTTVGTLDRQLIPKLKKLEEIGLGSKKQLPSDEVHPVTTVVRSFKKVD